MDTYSLFREIADSWVLLLMTAFFVGVIVWAYRPGSRPAHRDSAEIPFRHENKPASDDDQSGAHFKEART
ncbi:cbb3-type cytochrome c oxidase subunit 3 [Actibacterium sp.]|uniref:cbb3-type cytochrome c oxidase subunit 3 n=1 Tax=Actibacterium sp. TaxID=1872125 RepID=UPI00356B5DDC